MQPRVRLLTHVRTGRRVRAEDDRHVDNTRTPKQARGDFGGYCKGDGPGGFDRLLGRGSVSDRPGVRRSARSSGLGRNGDCALAGASREQRRGRAHPPPRCTDCLRACRHAEDDAGLDAPVSRRRVGARGANGAEHARESRFPESVGTQRDVRPDADARCTLCRRGEVPGRQSCDAAVGRKGVAEGTTSARPVTPTRSSRRHRRRSGSGRRAPHRGARIHNPLTQSLSQRERGGTRRGERASSLCRRPRGARRCALPRGRPRGPLGSCPAARPRRPRPRPTGP